MQPPLRMIINDPHSMTTELSGLMSYGLGASHFGSTDPIGSFLLELLKDPVTTAPLVPCPQHSLPSFVIITLG
jgi:hypothetical protein